MFVTSQSPQAGQFNSYLILGFREDGELVYMSQSPQAGQFNSYDVLNLNLCYLFSSLNPLKRVNSILTHPFVVYAAGILVSLNPLKRVNSILTTLLECQIGYSKSLNPLKRVNSILT